MGGGFCAINDTLGTDAVSGTTLGAVAGWGAKPVECGVNSYGNVGGGEGGVGGVSTACGTGISQLRSVVILFLHFFLVPK